MQSLSLRLPQIPTTHLSIRSSSSPSDTESSSSSSSSSRTQTPLFLYERNLNALVQKFKQHSQSYRFRCNRRFYDVATQRLASARRFKSIEEILEHQKQFSDITKEGFSIRLISLYGKSNMFRNARKLFDELPQLNCPRTVKSFNALLTAGLDSKEYETVTSIFHELASEISVEPNISSYNILIQAFCKMGSLDSALSVLESMEKDGLRPDLFTFNSLLNAFYIRTQFADAEKIWAEMEEMGCIPNIISYNSKLRGLVAEGKTEEAAKLVDELRDRGLEPDVFSFNALIKGYCIDGNLEEAKRIYDEMMINNSAPNRWTFEALIPCASERADLVLALELCHESINCRCSIEVGIVQAVVDALARESRVEEARKLVEVGVSKDKHYSSLKLPPERE